MTAEVALLNKAAVALAADSAMTLAGTGKIYPANKLFALSRGEPVGIMFYNSAEFMGVPWETLIKEYRDIPGKKSKARITECLEGFLEFIKNEEICTKDQQRRNALRIASDRFRIIYDIAFREIIDSALRKKKRMSARDEGMVIRETIEKQLTMMEDSGESRSMETIDADRIAKACRNEIDEAIEQTFGNLTVLKKDKRLFYQVFKLALKSAKLSRGNSGIVIAGFGCNERFPTLMAVTTDGMIDGKLKISQPYCREIGQVGAYSIIVPFAQTEMVQRFMEGIDPELLRYMNYSTKELLFQFGKEILDSHGLANEERVENLHNAAVIQVDNYFNDQVVNYFNENFVDSIVEAVAHLPKEELAGMAEALVSLTSLKRRVSLDQETVGGPIDSAVISKGDGFVWIKRKHYFDTTLNPGYVTR